MDNLFKKLLSIQSELKAPKSQYNEFGHYNYRNCEDILEAVKPLCKANGACLILTDEIVNIGDRFYVKATAILNDIESEQTIAVSALAREEESKKGMDGSQVTGSSSSYARKYALNGLFNIDDTKDADFKDNREQKQTVKKPEIKSEEPPKPDATVTKNYIRRKEELTELLDGQNVITINHAEKWMQRHYGNNQTFGTISERQYAEMIKSILSKLKER